MKIQQFEQFAGRTMLVDDNGMPVLVELKARVATTAPARLKAIFAPERADLKVGGKTVKAVCPEFRLEMN